MRAKILQLLKEQSGQYISGEDISRQLGISRTAVWKHIRELKTAGYDIEAHSRCGYCLKQVPDLLLPAEIKSVLKTRLLGQNICYHREVSSTNNEAKKLASDGCPEGTIVIAERQNGGRGRLSRGWFSPEGKGIWLSVVLRPPFNPQDAPKFTLMTAVAVNSAINEEAKVETGIKWPNDILYQGKKVVGILTEMSAEMDAINYIVIGIGVNVNIDTDDFPPDIAGTATSLSAALGQPVDRLRLLVCILRHIEKYYIGVKQNGFDFVLSEWRKQSITLGQQVNVIGPGGTYGGLAVDIDGDGALLVETDHGIERVLAGDVSIRPRSM